MATGQTWFKVPSALKFNLTGELQEDVSGKDVILHIIGMIGVDGALYKSMEFTGPGVASLSIDDRFTICNMAIEAGGKNGIFPVDKTTKDYMEGRVDREYTIYEADLDAEYDQVYDIDLSTLKPTVAFPHLPGNSRTIDKVGDVPIQQSVIGSCTNGRLSDMRIAAEILKGQKVHPDVRCIIVPATQQIYIRNASNLATWKPSSTQAVSFQHLRADHAWAATWVSWPKANVVFPPPTEIL